MPDASLPRIALLGGALLLASTATYWLGPIRAKARRASTGTPTPLAPLPEGAAIPAVLAPALDRHRTALEALGFRATPPMRDTSGRMAGLVQMFEHEAHGDVATVIAIPRAAGAVHLVLGFTSQLADGTRVLTGNSPLASVFPDRPQTMNARFPNEPDAARLQALHRAHVQRAGRQAPLRLGDPVLWQRREEERGFAWWQETGFVRRRDDGLYYTWKGACLACWKLQKPWKGRILARNERLRQELLGAAGLG